MEKKNLKNSQYSSEIYREPNKSAMAKIDEKIKRPSFKSHILTTIMKLLSTNESIRKQGGVANWGLKICEIIKYRTPNGYDYKKFKVDDVPVEILVNPKSENKDKVILQMHGGGYIFGLSDTYRKSAIILSRISNGATVVNFDYKIAPNNHFPDALVDAEKVYKYLLDSGYKSKNIIFIGDSAGGNLALSLTIKLRESKGKMPAGIVGLSPWTDLTCRGKSYEENKYNDPLFGIPRDRTEEEHRKYLMKSMVRPYSIGTRLDNPMLSVAYNTYEKFPPMLLIVSDNEILLSDSETVYEKAKSVGVDATLSVYHDMFHAFPVVNNTPEAKLAWKEVEAFFDKILYSKRK